MVYRYIVECCRGGPLTSVFRRSQAVLVTALLEAIIRNTFIIISLTAAVLSWIICRYKLEPSFERTGRKYWGSQGPGFV